MADIWTTRQDNGDVAVQYVEDPMVISSPARVMQRIRVELAISGYCGHDIVALERACESGHPGWRAVARPC